MWVHLPHCVSTLQLKYQKSLTHDVCGDDDHGGVYDDVCDGDGDHGGDEDDLHGLPH